ncbi:hypothetical protein F2Q69_00019713 [Brassica cretica]|uniref:Uncharacterized protein n=1 Tax=Brassica cretica TaxID=69181 RepID=A0A8S9QA77_BRACR|nr:hypothetical protein F2Q69_00019713 [Brassica cretica]
MCGCCVMTELGSIRTKLYLWNVRCDVFLTEHDLLRKDILVFCGDLDVNFVITIFDPTPSDRASVRARSLRSDRAVRVLGRYVATSLCAGCYAATLFESFSDFS